MRQEHLGGCNKPGLGRCAVRRHKTGLAKVLRLYESITESKRGSGQLYHLAVGRRANVNEGYVFLEERLDRLKNAGCCVLFVLEQRRDARSIRRRTLRLLLE